MQETRGRMREMRGAEKLPRFPALALSRSGSKGISHPRVPSATVRRRTPALASQKIHARPGFGNRPRQGRAAARSLRGGGGLRGRGHTAGEALCAVWLRRFDGAPLHNGVVCAPIDRRARSLPSVPTRMPPCIARIDFAALRGLRIAPHLPCGAAVRRRALPRGAG